MNLSSVIPGAKSLRFVNSQLLCLLPVAILNWEMKGDFNMTLKSPFRGVVITYYIILYYIILYYIILYYIILYYILFYFILLYYIILCCVVLCYVMLCYIILVF